ncbi:MAG: UvrD-helicase domain-containing protein [Nitrospinaceae bacterium]|nr:UvrD-helicase domain-containing protein [Nitrospinaceae bacterium]
MHLESLNSQQLEAVRYAEGPLLVVAGAGSGKTRVITCRIANLIQQGVGTDHILAITFTNKAAGEMKERVRTMLVGGDGPSPWISTFHSFCLRLLRRHVDQLGYTKDFIIYDAADQLSLIKQCMKSASIDEGAFTPKTLLHHISGFKNDFLLPQEVDLDDLPFGPKLKAAEVYPFYQAGLKRSNALDFDDLLVMAVRLLKESPSVLDRYSDQFCHILVDEFQDTNATQYQLVKLLSSKHGNVCAVGDDDQSIYRWRGANLENILNFENDFPGTRVIKLEENYRSTQAILKAASGVVKENCNRKPKTLWTQNEEGDPIVYYRADDETDEARTVCERALRYNREEGLLFNKMAVLYRTNAQSRAMEEALRGSDISYRLIGGFRFYERREIKDILAFVRVTLNPADSVSLRRIINVPTRGIGKTTLEKVEQFGASQEISLMEALREVGPRRLVASGAANKIAQFLRMMDKLRAVYENGVVVDFFHDVVEQTGYAAMLEKEDSRESRDRIDTLNELFTAVQQSEERGETLREFLDTTALVSDADAVDDSRGALQLMTLHTCKGLEYESVFIIGMEDGLLPHASSMSDPDEYEEERRLCYVGITRARKKLFISNARRRRIYGSTFNYPPSQFLISIPSDVLINESHPETPRYRATQAVKEPYGENPATAFSGSGQGGEYVVGTKVLHPKFGSGVVIKREGSEDDLKVDIFFKQPHGKKRIAVNHAKLIVI